MNNPQKNISLESDEIKEKINEDLAHLRNYPSIGKLFSEGGSNDLQTMRTKLNATKERLDTIIRRGSSEESLKASKALTAIGLTLQFLKDLEDERQQ